MWRGRPRPRTRNLYFAAFFFFPAAFAAGARRLPFAGAASTVRHRPRVSDLRHRSSRAPPGSTRCARCAAGSGTRVPAAPDEYASCAVRRWRSHSSRTGCRSRHRDSSRSLRKFALSSADCSSLPTCAATRFLVNIRVLRASSTRRPLIKSSTSRAFCGETRR